MSRALVLLLAVLAAPAAAQDDVGVNIRFFRNAYEQADTIAAAGIRWIRMDMAWSAVEQAPGRYDFSRWDRFVDAFEPFDIRVILILDYGNEIYEKGFPPTTEDGRSAFASYAAAAARHFRGRAMWEIWNEPNTRSFWVGDPDAWAYVALARGAAEAIRREDPGSWILGPALGGGSFDLAYLEEAFAAGLLEIVDAVSVHPYGASHPEAVEDFYNDVRGLMRRYARGRTLPIVVSEWGYRAEDLGPEGQADFLERAFAVNRKAGIPITIWFEWQEPIVPWSSFGLIDVRGKPKPAFEALTRIAR